jgi:hypothetical protein
MVRNFIVTQLGRLELELRGVDVPLAVAGVFLAEGEIHQPP